MNIAFMVGIGVIFFVLETFFGIRITSTVDGGYMSLAVYSIIIGFTSSFLSLATSRMIAKWMYPMELVVPERLLDYDSKVQLVYALVDRLSKTANITLPEVWVYQDNEPNAFATGPTKNRALVAVSSGLLDAMTAQEIEGVIGHEMAHIINGDMVTMTLVQGVMNAITIFIARIAAEMIAWMIAKSDAQHTWIRFGVTIVLEIALGFLAMIVVASYSRKREYRADEGSARLVWKASMLASLKKLNAIIQTKNFESKNDNPLASMQISSYKVSSLFSTHPPLEERILALESRFDLP
jgi:heat shock protein HtpX